MSKQNYKKVAVVTSTATALGLAITRNLVEQDYFVFGFLDRRDLESANADKLVLLPNVKILNGNSTSPTNWSGIAKTINDTCVDLDIYPQVDLFLNIPILGAAVTPDRLGEFELDMELREGLFGAFNGIQALKPLLQRTRNTKIINVYPLAQVQPLANITTAITSSALDMLTKCLAEEFGKSGICVNAVCPDSLDNGFYTVDTENPNSKFIATTVATIRYLIDGEGRKSNGQILFVQGNFNVTTSGHSILENVYV